MKLPYEIIYIIIYEIIEQKDIKTLSNFKKIDKNCYNFIKNKKIILNSIKGLEKLTFNIHNLPFQIKWNYNKKYIHKSISKNIKLFTECFKNDKIDWKEKFLKDIKCL